VKPVRQRNFRSHPPRQVLPYSICRLFIDPSVNFDFVDLIQVSDLVFDPCSIHKGLTSFQVKAFTRQHRSVRCSHLHPYSCGTVAFARGQVNSLAKTPIFGKSRTGSLRRQSTLRSRSLLKPDLALALTWWSVSFPSLEIGG